MFKGLSLDQAPPYEAPLRFFLTAPLFAVLGGFFLLFYSADTASFGSFAIFHLFTLGFITMIMMGAMQQMLPVLVGVTFPKPLLFSKIIHIFLILGTLLFAFGLLFESSLALFISTFFLLIGIFIFASITLYKLFKARHKSDTVVAMIFSLISLILALLGGSHLLVSLALGKAGESFSFVLSLHGSFAFFGWVSLLIAGVTYQVIPMFYVTNDFNPLLKRFFSFFIFGVLLFSLFSKYFLILAGLGYIVFGVFTLKAIESRKRKIKETSIDFWKLSMISLILASALFIASFFIESYYLRWILSIIFLYGFVISLICGMLYKIIPFLAWFHISSRGFFDMPTMKEMIEERFLRYQFYAHILSLVFLIIYPKIAGIFIVISNILLLFNLWQAVKIYFSYKNKPSPFDSFKQTG